jgi:monothiol glutaredoxin
MALDESIASRLSELVSKNRIVLFMKGTRRQPQCGFSAQVVKILDEIVPSYETVDVLSAPEIRQAIKEFSRWPTIPQLYVGGQFVGGCDIVRELSESGELRRLIGADEAPVASPAIVVSETAAAAFREYLAGAQGEFLRLHVDPQFAHDLFLGPRETGDVEVHASAGITFLLDPSSARRAAGTHIDFIPGPTGGFKIRNPSEPPRVKPLAPKDARAMLDRGEPLELFDVRTTQERSVARIDGTHHLDADGQSHLLSLDKKTPIAFLCHHGMRSRAAAEQALREGFEDVYNIEGGIDAWSLAVDPNVPRY